MRVISFDIGIKNMAYCILEVGNINENIFKIIDWKTINLMNEEDTIKPVATICSCNNKPKKGIVTKCSRHAVYMKSLSVTTSDPSSSTIQYFCDKHAKENTEYILPDKSHQHVFLNKLSIIELTELCNKYSIDTSDGTSQQSNRKKMIGLLVAYFKERSFEIIKHKKQKTSKETDIISIGYNMRRELNKICDFDLITNIIIENQISTLAARMNSIQGMLVQYFIMKLGDTLGVECIHNNQSPLCKTIEFISSSNKLKGLPPVIGEKTKPILSKKEKKEMLNKSESNHPVLTEEQTKKTFTNSKYKKHKMDGLYHCSLFLQNNPFLKEWEYVLNTKKKDDYADCLLQGIWYIKNKGYFKENKDYSLTS